MKNDLPIDPGKVHYPEEFEPNLIPRLRSKHYEKDNKYREIIIFCSSLVENMNWKLRLKFWWKGKYFKALIKTYDELLQKKHEKKALQGTFSYKNGEWLPNISDYHATGTRGKMMKLCSDLLSQMSRFNRFRFTYLLQYHRSLYITDKNNRKKMNKKIKIKLKKK